MPYVNGKRVSKAEYNEMFPLNERVKTGTFEEDGLEIEEREAKAVVLEEVAEVMAPKAKRTRRNKAQQQAAIFAATGVKPEVAE